MKLSNQFSMLATIGFIFVSISTQARVREKIDESYLRNISAACVKSDSSTKSSERKHSVLVCNCIAKAHYKSAAEDSDKEDGLRRIKWVQQLYEESDMKRLNEMMEEEDSLSSFDSKVAYECDEKFKPKKAK